MDPDPNKYDASQRVTHHETMSDAEWDGIYRDAWHAYYTPEHIERIGRRSAAQKNKGINLNEVTEFYLAYKLEGVHPLEGGLLRRRYRRDRRPGLPLEPALVFYPRHWARSFGNLARLAWGVWQAKPPAEAYFLRSRPFRLRGSGDHAGRGPRPPDACALPGNHRRPGRGCARAEDLRGAHGGGGPLLTAGRAPAFKHSGRLQAPSAGMKKGPERPGPSSRRAT
jgi:hypothetical protein